MATKRQIRRPLCRLFHSSNNTCIHEDLIPIHQLGHNPHIYRISPDHVQKAPSQPEYVGLGVLCMTLSHRISRIRTQGDSKALVQKFYHYRGNAIRSLSQAIDTTDRRFDDAVLAGILLLLLVDVQQGTSSTWRYHLDAIHKVVEARGGLPRLDASWGLQPLLRSFVMFSVIGNTTCPVPRITMAEWHLHKIHYITEQQSQGPTPFQLCPPVLFGEIIAINAIRTRTSVKSYGTIREAYEILERIHEFSPALWAKSKPIGREHWELAGQVYQAAVALYCILSSQSAFILPHDAMLPAYRAGHAQSLHMLLTDALSNPRIKRFMLWPLVVLGVEAANMEPAVRVCVAGRLADLSHHVGSYAPVEAKLVLETFWASGDTGWDSCFDKPYAFVTQSAVDLTGIPPSSGPV
ncbi:hypothetical protein OQA88_10995 [Cercophora sp. LCS_1]